MPVAAPIPNFCFLDNALAPRVQRALAYRPVLPLSNCPRLPNSPASADDKQLARHSLDKPRPYCLLPFHTAGKILAHSP